MNDHVKTVQAIYEAFGRRDIEAMLGYLDDDVSWEEWDDNQAQLAGVPWMAPRRGKDGVAEFLRIVGGFTFHSFNVVSLMAGGDKVAAEVTVEASVPSTGGHYRDQEMHLWSFNAAGRVVSFRHYLDTAKHIAVAKGNSDLQNPV